MSTVYRGMKVDNDGLPHVGRSAKKLGVRVDPAAERSDILADEQGYVTPGTGGMSVNTDIKEIPSHRRKVEQGGIPPRPTFAVFRCDSGVFAGRLQLTWTYASHHVVEPSAYSLLQDYETNLAMTRPHWTIV